MELVGSKEREQGARMRRLLVDKGFTKNVERGDERQEVWERGPDFQVVLTRVSSLHDPIEAEVFKRDFKPDVNIAYNASGLRDLLVARLS